MSHDNFLENINWEDILQIAPYSVVEILSKFETETKLLFIIILIH